MWPDIFALTLKEKEKNKIQQKFRANYGCRQLGAGHEHLKKLCCYLNMPEDMLSITTKATDSNQ